MTSSRLLLMATVVLLAAVQFYWAPKGPYVAVAKTELFLFMPTQSSLDTTSSLMQERLGYSCAVGHGDCSLIADPLDVGKHPASVMQPPWMSEALRAGVHATCRHLKSTRPSARRRPD